VTSERQLTRIRGSLLGLACGDALGAALEFKSPGTFEPIDDMVGGGILGLGPGEWTDDTSMALCLADSLTSCHGFDADDQMCRYVRWSRDGYMGVNGSCVDIGIQTRQHLSEFERAGRVGTLRVDPEQAGNGSIMRLAPVPLAYRGDMERAIEFSGRSSATTHPAPRTVDACRYLGALIAAAAGETPKMELLDESFWRWGKLHPEVEEIARGSFKRKDPPEIRGAGYVISSLEAALWALHGSESFRDGALLAVNLGDDADTTGAVYGQLAGAIYGEDGIPAEWRSGLASHDMIRSLADQLAELEL
jgi:ADP-ribosylglycohydrolase